MNIFFFLNVVIVLQSEPKLWRVSEIRTQSHCRIGRNSSVSFQYLGNPRLRNFGVFGKPVSCNSKWLKKFFHQDFPWVYVR